MNTRIENSTIEQPIVVEAKDVLINASKAVYPLTEVEYKDILRGGSKTQAVVLMLVGAWIGYALTVWQAVAEQGLEHVSNGQWQVIIYLLLAKY